MLVKSLLLFATAIVAAAASGAAESVQEPINAMRVCPDCVPCSVDCLCPAQHKSECGKTPPKPPRNPKGQPICPENEPCQADCLCPSAFDKPNDDPHGHHHLDVTVCAEGQPCWECDTCSFHIVMSYLNPSNLKGDTRICDVGVCNSTCVCREALLSSMKAVLFPPNGTKIIDFSPDADETADDRSEL